ncbi:hypothetical protein [Desulfosarcina ovata]|uniref:Uncharacterized protein n=2 Tax=Desulfosarcina ovata TaxID=83564 RepID=A0A5K8A476_9BACT|nr:hypothetical protein [Desulfosarcina ovata]BBO80078.1 hypothetical protein DSCO28_06440 [Desulfosarcina ovata subsp. sediminis]BBO87393.1 hypothetical protein DSCOOX_05730 [Desulfosarcina ovata subsp. ovata]
MTVSKNQNSPILVVLCAFGLAAFLVLVIYPNYRTLKEVDRKITALNEEIVSRQTLVPIYARLMQKAGNVISSHLKAPEQSSLALAETARLAELFQEIADPTGMTLESVVPDAEAVTPRAERLRVDVAFGGNFLPMQALIDAIAAQPFVDRIDAISITNENTKKRISLALTLFLRPSESNNKGA